MTLLHAPNLCTVSPSEPSRIVVPCGDDANRGDGSSLIYRSSTAESSASNGHRRNTSDPSAVLNDAGRCSAFRLCPSSDCASFRNTCSCRRPYHSHQHVSVDGKAEATTAAPTDAAAVTERRTAHPTPSSLVGPSASWNPFDLDDHAFGMHFDELPRRRGSASSKLAPLCVSCTRSCADRHCKREESREFGDGGFEPVRRRALHRVPSASKCDSSHGASINGLHMCGIVQDFNSDEQMAKANNASRYEKLVNESGEGSRRQTARSVFFLHLVKFGFSGRVPGTTHICSRRAIRGDARLKRGAACGRSGKLATPSTGTSRVTAATTWKRTRSARPVTCRLACRLRLHLVFCVGGD